MQWTDDGIVLGVKRHGETSVILELMTLERGRHLGLVRGGAGTRLRGVLHLGYYAVEGLNLRAAGFLGAAHAVHGVTHAAELCRLLAEREPHVQVFAALQAILDDIDAPLAAATSIARFELQLLAELGFGLDLAVCAATGATADLTYVSPCSGRAVSRVAGEEYRDKLLRLPEFLHADGEQLPAAADLADAFTLTGFFLDRHAFAPRGLELPASRARFVAAVMRMLPEQISAA